MWQEVDEGILPALYAAADPHARGGAFYGPRGFNEMAAAGSTRRCPRPRADPDCRRLWELSEQFTGVSYPKN